MIYRSLKEPQFHLNGSDVLGEAGFHRLSALERERLSRVNPDAAWHALSSTGILAKFKTDSRAIRVRVKLLMPANMEYMSAVGQCGVDLYVLTDGGTYRLLDVSRFDFKVSEYEADLGRFQDGSMRCYILHLPIYMGATDVSVGLDDGARCEPVDFSGKGRIAVYGTSIVQGGCVSRPGVLVTNILSRRFDREFLNFGFSGAANLEPEAAAAIGARRDLDLFFIDVEANAGTTDLMERRIPAFYAEFRKYHPAIPVVLVSRSIFAMDEYDENRIGLRAHYRAWLSAFARKARKRGEDVRFLDGSRFFENAEATVDGIHPSDLGAVGIAAAYERMIRRIQNDPIKSRTMETIR